MDIRPVSFGHPDAVRLNDRVQLEYAERFGDKGDVTPLDPGMFEPPHGLYLVVYDVAGNPVATGGWRAQDENEEGYQDGDAEMKRVYVTPEARGRGLSRRILAALEKDARAAGRIRMVLETGTKLPEAISLYLSSDYQPCAKFGPYRDSALSRCFAKPLNPAATDHTATIEQAAHATEHAPHATEHDAERATEHASEHGAERVAAGAP